MRSVLVGAGGLSPLLSTSLISFLPNVSLHTAYGMTEACSSITFYTINTNEPPPMQPLSPIVNISKPKSIMETNSVTNDVLRDDVIPPKGVYVGKPPIGIELAILVLPNDSTTESTTTIEGISNPNTNSISHCGYGEVLTRGPHVMLRYWNDLPSTAACFLPGGWFRTGDLGYVREEDGALWLVGRAKDVIKTGGENVAAAEVERTLLSHPAVVSVAVVGVEDSRLGERVAAAIILAPTWKWKGSKVQILGFSDQKLSSAFIGNDAIDGFVLQHHCRSGGLAGFKLPRMIAVLDSLPTNATGKVVKPQVKSLLKEMAKNVMTPRPRSRL